MMNQLLDRIAEVEECSSGGEISTFSSIMIDTLEEELINST